MFLNVLVIFFTSALICSAAPTLEDAHCGKPSQIEGATLQGVWNAESYSPGRVATYTCVHGYIREGSIKMACIEGSWIDISRGQCKVLGHCSKPQQRHENGELDGQWNAESFPPGKVATYICRQGYTQTSLIKLACIEGEWMPVSKGQCIADSSCGSPPNIPNGDVKEHKKAAYLAGEKVTYECIVGYTMGQNANFITCENSAWTEPPRCRRIGEACGVPPIVQNGDIIDLKRLSYPSGAFVKYKCANYYRLEGQDTIRCRDGEWEKEPSCKVPCIVTETDMQQNNIQLRWKGDKKLYSEHGDTVSFVCQRGYTISAERNLRIQCEDGVLKYPKCRKEGFCVLQQTEMSRNNIQYKKSNEIDNGEIIEFECVEGMLPENDLKGRCINTQITYPKCSAGRSCLPPKISNALVSPEKDSYESGSSIDIKCEDTFVLKGHTNVKCENGQWDELPQCFKPCTISALSLYKNHIEIKSSENPPEILEHGTEVNVKCKANFRRPGALFASCSNGTMKYPRCFSGCICRINQQDLDDNFLELDEKHEYEVFYGEGETVFFKCKDGYSSRTRTTGRCSTPSGADECVLTYPFCK